MLELIKKIASNDFVEPDDKDCQSVPPFVDFKILPKLPTIHPVLLSANLTEFKYVVVFPDFMIQLSPPLTVLRIKPSSPTTQPV